MNKRIARILTTLVAVLAIGLVACGDDDPPPAGAADDTPDTDDDPASSSAYPVTIEHANGSTTIEERPERIVTLNVQWTDAVLAMGEEPAGYVLNQASGETDDYPWQAGLLDRSERIDSTGEIPFEQIAALAPDLILATHLVTEAADLARLEEIAPTVGLLGGHEVDPWQDQIEVLGEILGDPDLADEVIVGVEGQVADLAAELPGLVGKTYVAANYVEGDGIYVIADPEDGASLLFYGLGMEIAPEVLALDEGAVGRVQISTEQVEVLDADVMGILTNGSDAAALPGWDQLTAVRTGAVVDFELADIVGLNTPTPVSLPYVMDLLRPALEVAAAPSPA